MVFVLSHTLRTAKSWALLRSWCMFHHIYALHITLICIGEMQYSDWCRMNWLKVLNVLINACLRVELSLFLVSWQSEMQWYNVLDMEMACHWAALWLKAYTIGNLKFLMTFLNTGFVYYSVWLSPRVDLSVCLSLFLYLFLIMRPM